MLAQTSGLEALPATHALRYRMHALARNNTALPSACCAHAWPAVELRLQPPRPRRVLGRARPFFADGDQQGSLTSAEEEQNGAAEISSADLVTTLCIESVGKNKRRIVVAIPVDAPLEALWNVLTDYERLAEFLPGLAVCEVQDRWQNGARLFQIGEQNLAFGLKFKARGVVNVHERPLEVLPCGFRREIDFEMIEGDFQVFKGTWRMEQVSNDSSETDNTAVAGFSRRTVLTYVLDVQPQLWLPIGLVEGILNKEIQTNLVCVRDEVLRVQSSLPA